MSDSSDFCSRIPESFYSSLSDLSRRLMTAMAPKSVQRNMPDKAATVFILLNLLIIFCAENVPSGKKVPLKSEFRALSRVQSSDVVGIRRNPCINRRQSEVFYELAVVSDRIIRRSKKGAERQPPTTNHQPLSAVYRDVTIG